MRSVLGAIVAAGHKGNDRSAVIAALFAEPERPSAVGPLKFDRSGDPATESYGAYEVRAGRLTFLRVVPPRPPVAEPEHP
jgi:ABC-type branched-subunit amino acid transport system substrate-binding protein